MFHTHKRSRFSIEILQREFEKAGFCGPVKLFNRIQCANFTSTLSSYPNPLDWFKSNAAHYRPFYDIAVHPQILQYVTGLIGHDVMIWGASLVRAQPNYSHYWHSDIETSYAQHKSISVWIGLEHVSALSALTFVSGSHKFGKSVQEIALLRDVERPKLNDTLVERWALEINRESQINTVRPSTGDALFFDGRIWHSGYNKDLVKTRLALLLQYSQCSLPIRTWENQNSPFQYFDTRLPPCIAIGGERRKNVNRFIDAPERTNMRDLLNTNQGYLISRRIKEIEFPLDADEQTGWKPYPIYKGVTNSLDSMSVHISVLSPDVIPHDPHQHQEEELLILLSGEADLVLVPNEIDKIEKRYRLRSGQLAYYPAFYKHTIHNIGDTPITYLMFKWCNNLSSIHGAEGMITITQFDIPSMSQLNEHKQNWETRQLFNFPTRHLSKLECHISLLQPGEGYQPHRDRYDVAILLLQGTIETLGKQVKPFAVIYYSAGEMHGMKNIGDSPAYYLVFEFHPGPSNKWLRRFLQVRRLTRHFLKNWPRAALNS